MAEVLSQSQIDALLSSIGSGDNSAPEIETPKQEITEEYRKYNFYSPKKFTRDKLKMLNGVFDNYARMLSSKLNGLFRTGCDVEVIAIEEQRYYEFSNALSENDVLGVINIGLNDNKKYAPMLMNMSTELNLAMIDMMIGGGDGTGVEIPFNYKYTDVELSIYLAIFKNIAKNISDAWNAFSNLSFDFLKLETNPSMVQLIGADETVVLVVLNIQLGGNQGKLNVCLPGSTLSNIFSQYEKQLRESQGHRTNDEEEAEILEALQSTHLDIKIKMPSSRILLRDASELKVGDVINLNRPKDSDVYLYIDNIERFSGKLGTNKKNLAVKINRMITPKV